MAKDGISDRPSGPARTSSASAASAASAGAGGNKPAPGGVQLLDLAAARAAAETLAIAVEETDHLVEGAVGLSTTANTASSFDHTEAKATYDANLDSATAAIETAMTRIAELKTARTGLTELSSDRHASVIAANRVIATAEENIVAARAALANVGTKRTKAITDATTRLNKASTAITDAVDLANTKAGLVNPEAKLTDYNTQVEVAQASLAAAQAPALSDELTQARDALRALVGEADPRVTAADDLITGIPGRIARATLATAAEERGTAITGAQTALADARDALGGAVAEVERATAAADAVKLIVGFDGAKAAAEAAQETAQGAIETLQAAIQNATTLVVDLGGARRFATDSARVLAQEKQKMTLAQELRAQKIAPLRDQLRRVTGLLPASISQVRESLVAIKSDAPLAEFNSNLGAVRAVQGQAREYFAGIGALKVELLAIDATQDVTSADTAIANAEAAVARMDDIIAQKGVERNNLIAAAEQGVASSLRNLNNLVGAAQASVNDAGSVKNTLAYSGLLVVAEAQLESAQVVGLSADDPIERLTNLVGDGDGRVTYATDQYAAAHQGLADATASLATVKTDRAEIEAPLKAQLTEQIRGLVHLKDVAEQALNRHRALVETANNAEFEESRIAVDTDISALEDKQTETRRALVNLSNVVGEGHGDVIDARGELRLAAESLNATRGGFQDVGELRTGAIRAAQTDLMSAITDINSRIETEVQLAVGQAVDNIRNPDFIDLNTAAGAKLEDVQSDVEALRASIAEAVEQFGPELEGQGTAFARADEALVDLRLSLEEAIQERAGLVQTALGKVNAALEGIYNIIQASKLALRSASSTGNAGIDPLASHDDYNAKRAEVLSALSGFRSFVDDANASIKELAELVGEDASLLGRLDDYTANYESTLQYVTDVHSERNGRIQSARVALESAIPAALEKMQTAEAAVEALQAVQEGNKAEYEQKLDAAKHALQQEAGAAHQQLEQAKNALVNLIGEGEDQDDVEPVAAGTLESKDADDQVASPVASARQLIEQLSDRGNAVNAEIQASQNARNAHVQTPGYMRMHGTKDQIDSGWNKIKALFNPEGLKDLIAVRQATPGLSERFNKLQSVSIIPKGLTRRFDEDDGHMTITAKASGVYTGDFKKSCIYDASVKIQKDGQNISIKPVVGENQSSQANVALALRTAMLTAKETGMKVSLISPTKDKAGYAKCLQTMLLVKSNHEMSDKRGVFSRDKFNKEEVEAIVNLAHETMDDNTFKSLLTQATSEGASDTKYVKAVLKYAREYKLDLDVQRLSSVSPSGLRLTPIAGSLPPAAAGPNTPDPSVPSTASVLSGSSSRRSIEADETASTVSSY